MSCLQAGVIKDCYKGIKLNFSSIKIATLNLSLGLQSKKNLVKQTILIEKIDLLCKQETDGLRPEEQSTSVRCL